MNDCTISHTCNIFRFRPLLIAAIFSSLFHLPADAFAGGGPENVVVVVNSESRDSQAIADHYVRLRKIPACNVIKIAWDPKEDTTDVEKFRRKILGPILQEIKSRGLTEQIHFVAYSSDFPWRIEAREDAKKNWKPYPPPRHLRPTCSISGLTYFYKSVMAERPMEYIGLLNNRYALRSLLTKKGMPTPSRAFDSTKQYGPRGEVVDRGGSRFLASVMLGVTAGRGNTVDEVRSYLTRSAKADGTQPKGTIYFCKNGNIRSKVRHPLFPDTVRELKELGVKAEIIEGVLPSKKSDVMGAMIGTASFNWKASESTILPGAICEHLTSFGGVMSANAGQTPLSAFLRFGAAGSSGTITEPFAIGAKFPAPSIHVHYARGCTLAEAFYQSVTGPYMLLIVGDPLCRPWANIPEVLVKGLKANDTVSGTLKLSPKATVPNIGKVERFELFVDGLRHGTAKPGEALALDTTKLKNGIHELRIVAIEAGPIQSQGRKIVQVTVDNDTDRSDCSDHSCES